MKSFLFTCIALMIVAGTYGAADMARDIRNDRLIDYEHVRERHAKSILFIIKTTGLGTHRFRPYYKASKTLKVTDTKQRKTTEAKEKKMIEYLEDFGRGCIECEELEVVY
jgi:hypothetical protein